MKPTEIISSELLGILSSLGCPIVITKNKEDQARHNFREDTACQGRWLDGFWKGTPKKILPGCGFVIHFVERESQVWIGEYQGTEYDEDSDRYSLVIDNVQLFVIQDLYELTIEAKQLLKILKKPGAVTYSYYQPELPCTAGIGNQLYKMVQVKVRLQQSAFRRAVFSMHGARCMITGCDTVALLDAAHLPGRYWDQGHNSGSDGIPLRVDLHRALDAGLIGLDYQNRINYLHPDLQKDYGEYLAADGLK